MDIRQDSIVFQSSLKIALEVEKFRAERDNRDVNVKKIIEMAKTIALVARNPELDEHLKNIQKSGEK